MISEVLEMIFFVVVFGIPTAATCREFFEYEIGKYYAYGLWAVSGILFLVYYFCVYTQ